MTPQGNGPPTVYQVDISGQTQVHLNQLHAQAAAQGKGHHFLAALRQILERLKKDPRGFGEPLYHLPEVEAGVQFVRGRGPGHDEGHATAPRQRKEETHRAV